MSTEDADERLAALNAFVATRHGGRCLAERYTRQAARYAFECARGHGFAASASNVLHRGSWCPHCAGNAPLDAVVLGEAASRIGARIDPACHVRGGNARVELVCAAGHRFELRGATLADGRATGCPTCRDETTARTMLDRTAQAAERNGLTLLDTSWEGRRSRVPLRCRCDHVFERGAESVYLVGRTRCPRCRGRAPTVSPAPDAPDAPDVRERLRALPRSAPKEARHALLAEMVRERHGGRLLSPCWTTLQARYRFRCADAHEFEATAANVIHRGSWCPGCAGNARLSIDTYAALADERGGELLPGQQVINRYSRLRFRCARDHVFELALQNLGSRQDRWCARCKLLDQREAEHAALDALATVAGYRLVSRAITRRAEALLFTCPAGHEWRCQSWEFRAGTRCAVCSANAPAPPAGSARRRGHNGSNRFT